MRSCVCIACMIVVLNVRAFSTGSLFCTISGRKKHSGFRVIFFFFFSVLKGAKGGMWKTKMEDENAHVFKWKDRLIK